MMRRAQKTAPDDLTRRVREVQAPFWPLLITTAATVAMYACKFFLHPAAVYVSLVAMVIARPCVIAVSTAFIRIRFPVSHFNRLMGVYGTVTAALMFLQYPHFIWAQHMYYTCCVNCFPLMLMPTNNRIYLFALCRAASEAKNLLPPEARGTHRDVISELGVTAGRLSSRAACLAPTHPGTTEAAARKSKCGNNGWEREAKDKERFSSE
ncbi:hypothetical protein E2C01_007485 [Portunus trituberculatus]|uniref:Uncharacterized protein n=1 Tax=Portunus trituberculatus TaxID=210409 RepID=A0A5B7D1A4_PORTR|nr:hypothetical protein [Portunus trituberculatus]